LLLIIFFYSFNLSFEFIARKIGFLISQGVVTTLYISTASIFFATVLALIGAVAKLSKNGLVYGLATFYTSLFRGLPLLMQIYIFTSACRRWVMSSGRFPPVFWRCPCAMALT
jgi:polar amino acid transport system permease protein